MVSPMTNSTSTTHGRAVLTRGGKRYTYNPRDLFYRIWQDLGEQVDEHHPGLETAEREDILHGLCDAGNI